MLSIVQIKKLQDQAASKQEGSSSDDEKTRRCVQIIEEAERYVMKVSEKGGDITQASLILSTAREIAKNNASDQMAVIKARMALLLARTELIRIERRSENRSFGYEDNRRRNGNDDGLLAQAEVTLSQLKDATRHL